MNIILDLNYIPGKTFSQDNFNLKSSESFLILKYSLVSAYLFTSQNPKTRKLNTIIGELKDCGATTL